MGCDLYRHFNASDELLYIGISKKALHRLGGHRVEAWWYDEIRKITIEKYSTRKDALTAERDAIKAEKPKYNDMHNPVPRFKLLVGIVYVARKLKIQNQAAKRITLENGFPTPVVNSPPYLWNVHTVDAYLARR